MESSLRSYGQTIKNYVFTQTEKEKEYDAYDKDIAVVEIYFKKSTVMQIGTESRMTW